MTVNSGAEGTLITLHRGTPTDEGVLAASRHGVYRGRARAAPWRRESRQGSPPDLGRERAATRRAAGSPAEGTCRGGAAAAATRRSTPSAPARGAIAGREQAERTCRTIDSSACRGVAARPRPCAYRRRGVMPMPSHPTLLAVALLACSCRSASTGAPPRDEPGMVRLRGGWFSSAAPAPPFDDIPNIPRVGAVLVDVTPVTVAQYSACVRAGRCSPARTTVKDLGYVPDTDRWSAFCNGDRPDRADHPANCVDPSRRGRTAPGAGSASPRRMSWSGRSATRPRGRLTRGATRRRAISCAGTGRGTTPAPPSVRAPAPWEAIPRVTPRQASGSGRQRVGVDRDARLHDGRAARSFGDPLLVHGRRWLGGDGPEAGSRRRAPEERRREALAGFGLPVREGGVRLLRGPGPRVDSGLSRRAAVAPGCASAPRATR